MAEEASGCADPVSRRVPRAALALWNDVESARLAEYERWHTVEHVPERVWAPGFIAGTRYVSRCQGQPRFFTLYELTSLASMRTPQYRSLVSEPTPWSISMRPSLRRFLRKTCTLQVDAGVVQGAGLLVIRLVLETGDAPALSEIAQLLMHHRGPGNVTRVQIGKVAQAGPQAIPNQDEAPSGTELLFLLQTSEPESLPLLRARFEALPLAQPGAHRWMRVMEYRMASRVLHSDVARPERPAPIDSNERCDA